MSEHKIADSIKNMAYQSDRTELIGQNIFVKRIFEFLYKQTGMRFNMLGLIKANGLILYFDTLDSCEDLSGYTISLEALSADKEHLKRYDDLDNFVILAPNGEEVVAVIKEMQKDMRVLLRLFDERTLYDKHLIHCLDSLRNAVSIYDKDANLLYANSNFCKDFQIDDVNNATGKHIRNILLENGIKVHSMETNSESLKMFDVLKKGEEALDWEVRLEYQDPGLKARLVSNDMYPVFDKKGEVEGMVELTQSRQQDFKRTKKIAGLSAEYTFDRIIGVSAAIREKIRISKEFANSPLNFLITGESGVGKELFAQSIHNYSSRNKGPFVALNCASFPEGLIESELFGYVGGAFTGASKNGQIGKFEFAEGGTLFLDEIGELPYHFQSKLLRVLETWMVTRIGSSKQIPVNVRLIAATNRDLAKMVEEGVFRQDLYYRIQVLSVEIPPLRERPEDVMLLANEFLSQTMSYDDTAKTFDANVEKALLEYDWPGNVRELRNTINRAALMAKSRVITREVLEASIYSKGYALKNNGEENPDERLKKRKTEVKAAYSNLLKEVLEITAGNKKRAAELLGVSRKTLYRMLEKYK